MVVNSSMMSESRTQERSSRGRKRVMREQTSRKQSKQIVDPLETIDIDLFDEDIPVSDDLVESILNSTSMVGGTSSGGSGAGDDLDDYDEIDTSDDNLDGTSNSSSSQYMRSARSSNSGSGSSSLFSDKEGCSFVVSEERLTSDGKSSGRRRGGSSHNSSNGGGGGSSGSIADDGSVNGGNGSASEKSGSGGMNERRRKAVLSARERNLRRLESNERERQRMHSLNDAFQEQTRGEEISPSEMITNSPLDLIIQQSNEKIELKIDRKIDRIIQQNNGKIERKILWGIIFNSFVVVVVSVISTGAIIWYIHTLH